MRRQLALGSLAVTSMVVLAFVVPLALLVRSVAADRALNAAEREAQTLAPVLATVTAPAALRQLVEGADASADGDLTVFLADGTVLGARAAADDNVTAARRGRAFTSDAPGGRQVLVPVVVAAGRVDVVRVFVPNSLLRRSVGSAWLLLGALAVGLVAGAAVFADRLGRFVVGPARELARTAERLSEGDLAARVEPDGPPELVEVGSTMNRLAARISALLHQEREDVADLSHRLRTPVTALRLDVESLRDPGERERLNDDVDALARAVDWLIAEARHPEQKSGNESCDLVEVTRGRVRFWAVLAEDQDRPYTVDIEPVSAAVAAPRRELEAALDALLGNVFAHTPDRTPFHVHVELTADGARLTISDEGPGFAHRALQERGASGGGSSGLGLDIVRRTAAATGGRVALGARPSGGAQIDVDLGPPSA